MAISSSTVASSADSLPVTRHRWEPPAHPVGIVQISHGLAEHGPRYDRLATALTAAGYAVHTSDHRGHGSSVNDATPLGSFGAGGWNALVSDMVQLGTDLRAQAADLPVFLIAHSMGSFAAQQALLDHSSVYSGVVLSGSTALDRMAAAMAASPAPVGDLSAFNAGFEQRTGYEWLSRDEAEVDAYVADPLCGFELPADTVPQLFGEAARLADPAALSGIRADLPLLIASGDTDPLAGGGELIQVLAQRYRDAGLRDVTLTVYPGARHEIFNETNRDEVTADVIAWLDAHR